MTKETDLEKIYTDADFFIRSITTEYGFYDSFIRAVEQGRQEFAVKRKTIHKNIDEQWVLAVEQALPALDKVIRTPSKFIEEREEVLPIELSHNINNRSIRHLAQHTDFISKIEGDQITPSKILNVFHEETLMTYENKFINTLIARLYAFVSRRYQKLMGEGETESGVSMDFASDFTIGTARGKISFAVEVDDRSEATAGASISERIRRLNSVVTAYMESSFVKAMGKNMVRPPIMRTNAITKNKDLHQCLVLWEFIESYDKVGYAIEAEETAEKPSEQYVQNLYSLLSLQYLLFAYHLDPKAPPQTEILDHAVTDKPVLPRFKNRVDSVDVDDYHVYDCEYRRVVPVSQLAGRKLSEDELRIRLAVDLALTADKVIVAEQDKKARRAMRSVAGQLKARKAQAARKKSMARAEKEQKRKQANHKEPSSQELPATENQAVRKES